MPILGIDGTLMPRKAKRRKKTKLKRSLCIATKQMRLKLRKPKKSQVEKLVEANPVRNYQAYALELEHGMYYVGITARADVTKRFNQHLNGTGAKWTKLHKPIAVIETRRLGRMALSDAAKLEDKMTLEYMELYGTYKVRGGGLCQVDEKYLNRHLARIRADWRPIGEKSA